MLVFAGPFSGNPIFAIVTTLIMLLGLDEFFKMCEIKGSYPNRIFGFIITVFIGLAYSGVYAHHQITVLGLACMTVISLFIIEIINNKKEPLQNIANTVLGIIFVDLGSTWTTFWCKSRSNSRLGEFQGRFGPSRERPKRPALESI